jgi:hypothetical protein
MQKADINTLTALKDRAEMEKKSLLLKLDEMNTLLINLQRQKEKPVKETKKGKPK